MTSLDDVLLLGDSEGQGFLKVCGLPRSTLQLSPLNIRSFHSLVQLVLPVMPADADGASRDSLLGSIALQVLPSAIRSFGIGLMGSFYFDWPILLPPE